MGLGIELFCNENTDRLYENRLVSLNLNFKQGEKTKLSLYLMLEHSAFRLTNWLDFPASARRSKPRRFANRAASTHAAERKNRPSPHR